MATRYKGGRKVSSQTKKSKKRFSAKDFVKRAKTTTRTKTTRKPLRKQTRTVPFRTRAAPASSTTKRVEQAISRPLQAPKTPKLPSSAVSTSVQPGKFKSHVKSLEPQFRKYDKNLRGRDEKRIRGQAKIYTDLRTKRQGELQRELKNEKQRLDQLKRADVILEDARRKGSFTPAQYNQWRARIDRDKVSRTDKSNVLQSEIRRLQEEKFIINEAAKQNIQQVRDTDILAKRGREWQSIARDPTLPRGTRIIGGIGATGNVLARGIRYTAVRGFGLDRPGIKPEAKPGRQIVDVVPVRSAPKQKGRTSGGRSS